MILDGLLTTYLSAKNYLVTNQDGSALADTYWICSGSKCPKWNETRYKNKEVPLYSAQFIYLLASAVKEVASFPPAIRTPTMKDFANQMAPIVMSHLNRWVFASLENLKAFKPDFTCVNWDKSLSYNHFDFMKAKKGKEFSQNQSYCNAITDLDMLILGAVSEMLLAKARDKALFAFPIESYVRYFDYVSLLDEFVASRYERTFLGVDTSSPLIAGALFERNSYTSHPEYEVVSQIKTGVGWDLGHYLYRFPLILDSLTFGESELIRYAKLVAPKRRLVSDLIEPNINQIVYAMTHYQSEVPLFSNFMDGTNAWYGKSSSGHEPFSLSNAVAFGGFGGWASTNRGAQAIMRLLLSASRASSGSPQADLWKKYYIKEGDNPNVLLLMFLPSLSLN